MLFKLIGNQSDSVGGRTTIFHSHLTDSSPQKVFWHSWIINSIADEIYLRSKSSSTTKFEISKREEGEKSQTFSFNYSIHFNIFQLAIF